MEMQSNMLSCLWDSESSLAMFSMGLGCLAFRWVFGVSVGLWRFDGSLAFRWVFGVSMGLWRFDGSLAFR